jgi:rod shape-determining protein MreC
VGAILYPAQWLALKPVQMALGGGRYFDDLQTAQRSEADARKELAKQAERASQSDSLAQDNARLRSLLELRQTTPTPGRAAEVLYDAADPYTRKIIIDQGITHGIAAGSPVIDERGVLGQVTLVQPFTSEVTLVIDRDLAIPVQNTRTGARSVAFGDPNVHGGGLELRFMAANADLREGDMLATSGVDGVYPAGLPVARIDNIERRADSAFARIHCVPLAATAAARYVLVLSPVGSPTPRAAPAPVPESPLAKKKSGDKDKTAAKASDKAAESKPGDKPTDKASATPAVDKATRDAQNKADKAPGKPDAHAPAKPLTSDKERRAP